jgi:hypothetical protein
VSLKVEVGTLLRAGDDEGLARLVAGNPRAVRHLLPRLWDEDDHVRRAAAGGLGEAAARHPDLALEVVRRLMWALNDESGTHAGRALIGLGAMGRRAPDLLAPFTSALAAMAGDQGLREELLRALGVIAAASPATVAPYLADLERAVDLSQPGERTALDALRAALTRSDS